MDELDKRLANSKNQTDVSHDLSDNIMSSIKDSHELSDGPSFWRKHRLVLSIVPVFVVVVIGLLSLGFKSNLNDLNQHNSRNKQSGSNPSNNNDDAAEGSPSAGTDDASLASDLSSIGSSLNENDQSFNAASNAINNQQLDNLPTD